MSPITKNLRWLTLIIWQLWLLIYWQGGKRIATDIKKSTQTDHTQLEPIILSSITILSSLVVVTGFLQTLGKLQPKPQPKNQSLLGFLLTFIGMSGTFYARNYLGRFWSAETRLEKDHQVINSGPYALVRHPIYTAALTMYTGTAIVFSTWWNWLACTLVALAYALKTYQEDNFLAQTLPGYTVYQQQVPYRLFPAIW